MKNNELYSLLASLVSTNSVSGNEKDIVDFLDDKFTSLGFAVHRMESGSICGVLDGDRPGKTVLLDAHIDTCLLYTSPSPRDRQESRMPSSA